MIQVYFDCEDLSEEEQIEVKEILDSKVFILVAVEGLEEYEENGLLQLEIEQIVVAEEDKGETVSM